MSTTDRVPMAVLETMIRDQDDSYTIGLDFISSGEMHDVYMEIIPLFQQPVTGNQRDAAVLHIVYDQVDIKSQPSFHAYTPIYIEDFEAGIVSDRILTVTSASTRSELIVKHSRLGRDTAITITKLNGGKSTYQDNDYGVLIVLRAYMTLV